MYPDGHAGISVKVRCVVDDQAATRPFTVDAGICQFGQSDHGEYLERFCNNLIKSLHETKSIMKNRPDWPDVPSDNGTILP